PFVCGTRKIDGNPLGNFWKRSMPPSTVWLTERVSAECCLSAATLDFLLAEHRTHLELVPTGQPGHYRLTPAGFVGILVSPDCRLVIQPKIPLANVLHLLEPAWPLS